MSDVQNALPLESAEERLFVLSSNYAIAPLFARGVLVAPVWGVSSETAFLDEHGVNFLCASGKIPWEWTKGIEDSARNSFPILIALKDEQKVRIIRSEHGEFPYITIRDVESLVFRSEKEMKRFASWKFENYEVLCPLAVDDTRFEARAEAVGSEPSVEQSKSADSTDGEPNESGRRAESVGDGEQVTRAAESAANQAPISPRESESRTRAFHRAEALAAVLAVHVEVVPALRTWMYAIASFGEEEAGMHPTDGPGGWMSMIYRALESDTRIRAQTAEDVLLLAGVDVLLRYPISEGWPAAEVLDQIVTATNRHIASGVENDSNIRERIEVWHKRSREVLDQKVEHLNLSDRPGGVVRRALMLLLLRGDLNGIEDTPVGSHGALQVGRDVKALAACLAAIRFGLRALPSRFKSVGKGGDARLEVFGEQVIGGFIRILGGNADVVERRFDVEYKRHGEFDGDWRILRNGVGFHRRRAEFDPSLTVLVHRAKTFGYSPTEASENNNTLCIEQSVQGTRHVVHVTLVGQGEFNNEVVRFWAKINPSSALGEGKRRRTTKANWKKDDLQEFLMRNSDPDMQCRYALDRTTHELIALVDQLFGTLDDTEYRAHVNSVAEAAHFALTRR